MKAKSIKGNLTKEIQSALEQSIVDGFKPTLSSVFLSINWHALPMAIWRCMV